MFFFIIDNEAIYEFASPSVSEVGGGISGKEWFEVEIIFMETRIFSKYSE